MSAKDKSLYVGLEDSSWGNKPMQSAWARWSQKLEASS